MLTDVSKECTISITFSLLWTLVLSQTTIEGFIAGVMGNSDASAPVMAGSSNGSEQKPEQKQFV